MSGGHYEYKQYHISEIAESIESLIWNNSVPESEEDEWRSGDRFSPETIEEFKKAVEILKIAYVYAQRIDWLVSGDDGEDTFHARLKHDLDRLKEQNGG